MEVGNSSRHWIVPFEFRYGGVGSDCSPPGGEGPAIFSVVYFRVSLSFIYIVSSQSGICTLCACFFQRGQRQIKRVSCSFPWEKRQRGVAIWTQYEPWRHPLRLPEKASCVWRVFNWIPLLHLCRPLLLSVCKRASDALVSDSCRFNYLLTGRHNSGLGRRTVGTATTKIEGLCISVCYVGLLKNSRLHGNEIYFLHFAAGNNNIFLFLLSLMVFFFLRKMGSKTCSILDDGVAPLGCLLKLPEKVIDARRHFQLGVFDTQTGSNDQKRKKYIYDMWEGWQGQKPSASAVLAAKEGNETCAVISTSLSDP